MKPALRNALKFIGLVTGLFLLWGLALIAGENSINERVPVKLPPMTIFHGEGFASAHGTWVIEGNRQAFPMQVTEIDCYQKMGYCFSAQAEIGFGETLNAKPALYSIKEWTSTAVVFIDAQPLCVTYVYTINWATRSASAVRTPRPGVIDICEGVEKNELRLTLRSGGDVVRELRREAEPWYMRLALFPFR